MATEERVVLVAQLQDELSAPLTQATDAVEGLTRSTERARGANGRYVRTVEDTAQATTRARSANGAFARSVAQVTGETDSSTRGMGRLSRAISQISTPLRAVGSAIQKPFQVIGSSIQNITVAGVKSIGLIGGALGGLAFAGGISRALNIEQAQAKLAGLGHSVASVEQIMKNASAAVKGTAFGLGDAAGVAAGAVAAGVAPGKALERVLKLTGDAATIAGVDMNAMGSIFNKVAASGKLQGDVIQSLQDSGIPILQLVSKELGVTAEEAAKMASEGKVSFETFTKAMENGLGGAALKSGETFTGALSNTKAALSRIGETLANPFLGALKSAFNVVIPLFDSVNKSLKPVMDMVEKKVSSITPKLQKMSDGLLGIGKLLGGDYSGLLYEAFGWEEDHGMVDYILRMHDGLGKFVSDIKPFLGPIVGALLAMATTFGSLIPVVGQFLPVINPVVGLLIGLIATSPELRSALGGAFQALLPIFGQVSQVLGTLLPVLADIATTGVLAIAWILELLNPALPVLVPLVLALVVGFKAASIAMGLWRGATTLWTAVQVGHQAALGTNTALTEAQTMATQRGTRGFVAMKVAQYATTVATWAQAAATGALAIATNAAVWPVLAIIAAVALLVGGFILAYNRIGWFKDGVNAAMQWIQEAFANVVDWWNTNLMPAIQAIGQWFSDVFHGVQDVIGVVVDWLKSNWDLVLAILTGPIGLAVRWIVQHWSEITAVFSEVWDNIVSFTTDFVDGLLAVLGTIGGWFSSTFGPSIRGIGDVFAAVFGWVERFVWNAMTIIMAIFYALVDLWNGVLKPALDILAGWFGDILGWIGQKIEDYVGMWVDFFGMIVDWWNNTLAPALAIVYGHFQTVLGWIGDAIGWYVGLWVGFFGMIIDFWNNTLKPGLDILAGWIQTGLSAIGDAIGWYIGLWLGFFGMIVDWWNNTLFPALQAIGGWFSSVFNWIYNTVIAPVVGFIIDKFRGLIGLWNDILGPAIDLVAGWFRDTIGGAISGVTGVIENVKSGFGGFISFWGDKLRPVVDAISESFRIMGDVIGAAVGAAKDFASNPLGGIQDMLGIGKDANGQGIMPTRNSGGGVYAFDGGGVLGGYAPGVDNTLALLSPGESVLVPELTRALGPANILAANHAASGGRTAGSTAGFSRGNAGPPPAGSSGGGGVGVLVAEGAVQVTVVAQPGQSTEDIGQAVADAVNEVFEEMKRRGY